jgi:hypothetical protein
MKTLGSVLLGAACLVLLLASPAQAHKLTVKKARAALAPLLAETTPLVAQQVAAKLPGATVADASVGFCEIRRKGHRADCQLTFRIVGATTGETECIRLARVEFRSTRSNKLKISRPFPRLGCFFELDI